MRSVMAAAPVKLPFGRTVAAGNALLSPAVTKQVIRKFTRIPRAAPPKEEVERWMERWNRPPNP